DIPRGKGEDREAKGVEIISCSIAVEKAVVGAAIDPIAYRLADLVEALGIDVAWTAAGKWRNAGQLAGARVINKRPKAASGYNDLPVVIDAKAIGVRGAAVKKVPQVGHRPVVVEEGMLAPSSGHKEAYNIPGTVDVKGLDCSCHR